MSRSERSLTGCWPPVGSYPGGERLGERRIDFGLPDGFTDRERRSGDPPCCSAISVLAAMLAKRAPGYAGLGFADPRRLALTPSASTDS
jgi:hypothetical protein